MCDSEDTYDLVMENRYNYIEKGDLGIFRFYGVKFLAMVGNILYKTKVKDYNYSLRGFNKEKIDKLDLECEGMEFAGEIIIKCKKANYSIVEVSTKLFKADKGHISHINT